MADDRFDRKFENWMWIELSFWVLLMLWTHASEVVTQFCSSIASGVDVGVGLLDMTHDAVCLYTLHWLSAALSLTCLPVHQSTPFLMASLSSLVSVTVFGLNSWEYCKLGHYCRRVHSHRRDDATRLHRWELCLDLLRFLSVVVSSVHTANVTRTFHPGGGVNRACI